MRYVIIGNGAAGVTAAETIREHDAAGEIVLFSAEPHRMYSRPGLAYVVMGEIPLKRVIARSAEWYADQRIDLRFERVTQIDTTAQTVALVSGASVRYDRLLIATGARAVHAPYENGNLKGIVYLDTYDGTRELLRQTRRGLFKRRGVVIGGGITALEMTEGFAAQGVETHYFVRRDRLWNRVFNPTEAEILQRKMEQHGVTIHYNCEVAAVEGSWRGRINRVQLKNGDYFNCDLLGVGIGVRPQLEVIAGSAILQDRAILVDEWLQTSAHNVFAAGDCAQVYDRWSDRHLLDILWPSAVAEGRTAGLNMVGKRTAYRKGTPFNAALLFGLHITAIGQVNPTPAEGDGVEERQSWSRGASEVWFTFPRQYSSAWQHKGDNSLRLVLDGSRLVGALVVGEQTSADPLRDLIENERDITPILPHLDADRETLQAAILRFWREQCAA
jgi:NAD(P)H-nitrite reductase large subunit